MNRHIERFAHIPLKSGVGVFEAGGVVHRVEVALTPLGLVRLQGDEPDLFAIVTRTALALARRLRTLVPARALRIVKLPDHAAAPSRRVKPVNVGIRPSAVTLHAELCEEGQGAQPGVERDERSKERRSTKVLEDSIVVAAGKRRVRLTARARIDELNSIAMATGMDPALGHRFEPAPWAVWRASIHYAPIKTAEGVHLRYVLGDGAGIAVLSTAKRPLAWQVLSWERNSHLEVMVQAYHLLYVHAVRRLHFAGIEEVSIQGDAMQDAHEKLAAAVDARVEQAPGPIYDADLIAFGLAMGGLEAKGELLNLARVLQAAPSVFQLVPWAEASFLLSLLLCMYLMLHAHVSGLRQKLRVSTQESNAVMWAHGVSPSKLKQELDGLRREVDPLGKFLTREVSFGRSLSSVADQLPPKAWLVAVAGEDHFWEKNANKSLGERYLMLTAGAPSEREGLAPPEINTTVHGIDEDAYLEGVLPRVKLTDVNWRQQGGHGYSVFSLLALPKETKETAK